MLEYDRIDISEGIDINTSPWELMDPRTKNDSDKTQDIKQIFDKATSIPVRSRFSVLTSCK